MKHNRRNFLKFAGVSAAALCFSPSAALASSMSPSPIPGHPAQGGKLKKAARWAMVIDTRKLTTEEAMQPLIKACHDWHNVPEIPAAAPMKEHGEAHASADAHGGGKEQVKQEIKWLWSDGYHACFPDQANPQASDAVAERPYLLLCNHCDNPPCVRVCPTKATFQRPDGIVAMDYHRCIGCRYCMAGCPYGSRSFNFRDPKPFIDPATRNPEFPARMRGVVEKCNFCVDRLAQGMMPACVEASKGALVFGDLDDPDDPVREVLRSNFTMRRKPTLGTEPHVFYII